MHLFVRVSVCQCICPLVHLFVRVSVCPCIRVSVYPCINVPVYQCICLIVHQCVHMNKTTCSSDPFPTRLLMSHLLAIIPIIQHIVNLCLTTGSFPISCKSSIVIPLIKKPSLDREMLNNYRPISNLSFLSKVIEKVISIRILGHILNNNIVDSFQSAYRAGHSCKTALLRVYMDIVTIVGNGNGSFLVLLDLSAAFDTIDHDNLFYILEKYVGIGGSALRLIRSCFHVFVIVLKESKLMVLCLILLILAITSTRMTRNSTFHLNVRIRWIY